MAAKIAPNILGGLLLISGLAQFINVIQLQAYSNTFMGAAIDEAINEKIEFGIIFILIGGLLIFCGFKIKAVASK